MKRFSIANSRAFSLVEVTMSLGIVSFALIAVLGLLPVGLRSVKNANEQAGAANVLNAIADSLRTAGSTDSVLYTNHFSGQTIQYSMGGASLTNTWTNLKLDGSQETAADPKRISAVANITPPASPMTPGYAVISVAWPAQAGPSWNADTQTWTKAEGSLTVGIQFLPP
jgi:type II secretory pathway pseudopilin PulG